MNEKTSQLIHVYVFIMLDHVDVLDKRGKGIEVARSSCVQLYVFMLFDKPLLHFAQRDKWIRFFLYSFNALLFQAEKFHLF